MRPMDHSPHKRRRFQFSLRTYLIAICLLSALFGGWVNWSRHWIRQRHEWLNQDRVMIGVISYPSDLPIPAPFGLSLFGEDGVGRIGVFRMDEEGLARTQSLFPEARIITWVAPPK